MSEGIIAVSASELSLSIKQETKPLSRRLQWVPTSTDHIITAEKRLLSLVKTGYTTEQINIGSGPPGSKIKWFRSSSNEPHYINTVTFDSSENAPTLVLVHGYGASHGFFFRNFDALASKFRVIAVDQLGTKDREWYFFCPRDKKYPKGSRANRRRKSS